MGHLQNVYAKYRDKGLVVLGVNTADLKEFATEQLEQDGVSFPNILDTSPEASKAMEKYGGGAVPMNYLIDRDGKVIDSWYASGGGVARGEAALEKLGIK